MGNTIYYPSGNTSSSSGTPASNNNSTSYINLLTNMLQTGMSLSNGDGSYCCPTCIEKDGSKVYFIAGIPRAIQILTDLGYQLGDTLPCCTNISSVTSTAAYSYFNSLYTYECCPNNFTACVNELTSKLGAACCNELQQIGIVEYGTLDLTESSPFCFILTNLLKVTPTLTSEEICAIYKEILDIGIVIKCDGCTTTIEKGPDYGACFCYKITVPETAEFPVTIITSCQDIITDYKIQEIGDYYYCSSVDPLIVDPDVTFIKQSDCSLAPCVNPALPCICYEFAVDGVQIVPIPIEVTCQGQATTHYLTQGVYRFCSDTYPGGSPGITVTALNDCAQEPCVSPPPPSCKCYRVQNPNLDIACEYSYEDCNTNNITIVNILAGEIQFFCAKPNTVVPSGCSPLTLIISEYAPDCSNCVPPIPPTPPIPCNCYQITMDYPGNPGILPTCTFDYTDCDGNAAQSIIVGTGYICSQVVPTGACKGANVAIQVIPAGDCTNPAIGCPPIIP